MIPSVIEVFNHALMITGFVFVMMLVIEYLNVLTRGAISEHALSSKYGKYFFAAMMGVIPGCLGAFVIVTMYSHRMTSKGAVLTAMIATSGDEAFVMLAMVPGEALILMGILFVLGTGAGWLMDMLLMNKKWASILFDDKVYTAKEKCEGFQVHDDEAIRLFPVSDLFTRWKSSTPERVILSLVLVLWMTALVTGQAGPGEWNWVRITILLVSALGFFIVVTVPGHFIKEHLWQHVARKHIPGIFVWTFGALLVIDVLMDPLNLELMVRENTWLMMGLASLVGLIPESGPHLFFVTLFANGSIPFSILLVNSVVQDGHGMLPLFSHSPRTFLLIKLINFVIGFSVGTVIIVMSRFI